MGVHVEGQHVGEYQEGVYFACTHCREIEVYKGPDAIADAWKDHDQHGRRRHHKLIDEGVDNPG